MSSLSGNALNAIAIRWAWIAMLSMEYPSIVMARLEQEEPTAARTTTKRIAVIDAQIRFAAAEIIDYPPSEPDRCEDFADSVLRQVSPVDPMPEHEALVRNFQAYLSEVISTGDPIGFMWSSILEITRYYYSSSDTLLPRTWHTHVGFSAEHSQDVPPHSFPSGCNAALVTIPGSHPGCSQPERHIVTVFATLAPAYFDEITFASLPYALFHESVSHVVQVVASDGVQVPDAGSQFAEGWMDRAAWIIFNRALLRTDYEGPALAPNGVRPDFFIEGAETYRAARYRVPASGDADYRVKTAARNRKAGWESAGNVIDALRTLRVQDAELRFLDLALALNTSQLAPFERDLFVCEIARRLGTRLRGSDSGTALRELRSWSLSGDLDELAHALR